MGSVCQFAAYLKRPPQLLAGFWIAVQSLEFVLDAVVADSFVFRSTPSRVDPGRVRDFSSGLVDRLSWKDLCETARRVSFSSGEVHCLGPGSWRGSLDQGPWSMVDGRRERIFGGTFGWFDYTTPSGSTCVHMECSNDRWHWAVVGIVGALARWGVKSDYPRLILMFFLCRWVEFSECWWR